MTKQHVFIIMKLHSKVNVRLSIVINFIVLTSNNFRSTILFFVHTLYNFFFFVNHYMEAEMFSHCLASLLYNITIM